MVVPLQARARQPQGNQFLKLIGQNTLFTFNLSKYDTVKGWSQWYWFPSPPGTTV